MEESLHLVCAHCEAINRVPKARLDAGPRCARCHQPLTAEHPLTLQGSNFDRHLEHTGVPLVVDFWAPWCGPCVQMAPQFEAAAQELAPGVRLAKLDTEDVPAIAQRFGIRSIPTLILFEAGREVARQSGALGKAQILRWVREHAGQQ
jgi:thioredoxin 2